MVQDIRVRLDARCYITLPVTTLAEMDQIVISTKRVQADSRQKNEKASPQNYTLGFDEDGLLSVRGLQGEDRWVPVLTPNTSRWIRRFKDATGLVTVNEIELDGLAE